MEDKNGREMLLMGKGIGYKKKSGESADVKAAQKIFTRFDKKQILKFKRLMEEIPYEYMHITNEIVEYAQMSLGKELDENIYLALVDHLNFAVNRIRQGIRLSNSMLWEIRHYYNHEYRIGLEAIAIIQKYAGLEMPIDEAGFIAVHILNAELNLDMDHSRAMTKITAKPMPTAVSIFLDTPMKGQMPRNWARMKLLIRIAPRAMSNNVVHSIGYFPPLTLRWMYCIRAMRQPSVRKPPTGRASILAAYSAGKIREPFRVPAPKSSRMALITRRIMV